MILKRKNIGIEKDLKMPLRFTKEIKKSVKKGLEGKSRGHVSREQRQVPKLREEKGL